MTAMLAKLAILTIFCQFRQISSSIGIDTAWVNISDFSEIYKIGNLGDLCIGNNMICSDIWPKYHE